MNAYITGSACVVCTHPKILKSGQKLKKKMDFHYTLTGKKNGTLISQQQIIPIIPILMYFDQEEMIANITLSISIGYFISNFA
jgi:hypothetical protein